MAKAIKKRNSKPAPRKGVFKQFPTVRTRLADDEVNIWIDVALAYGATFHVSYADDQIEMSTGCQLIATDGLFSAFLAYARAFPEQFGKALRERGRGARSTVIVSLTKPQKVEDYCVIVEKRS